MQVQAALVDVAHHGGGYDALGDRRQEEDAFALGSTTGATHELAGRSTGRVDDAESGAGHAAVAHMGSRDLACRAEVDGEAGGTGRFGSERHVGR